MHRTRNNLSRDIGIKQDCYSSKWHLGFWRPQLKIGIELQNGYILYYWSMSDINFSRCYMRIWDKLPLEGMQGGMENYDMNIFRTATWVMEMSPEDLRQSPLEGMQGSMENYNMDIFCIAVWAMLVFGDVTWGSKLKFEARSPQKDIKFTHPLKEWRIMIWIYFVLQCEQCWILEKLSEDLSQNLKQGHHIRTSNWQIQKQLNLKYNCVKNNTLCYQNPHLHFLWQWHWLNPLLPWLKYAVVTGGGNLMPWMLTSRNLGLFNRHESEFVKNL